MTTTPNVKCIHCKHYYVTWDKQHPYGCKRLGFKAAIEPALVVLRASGHRCLAFAQKPSRQRP
jgi:hypothetical protein